MFSVASLPVCEGVQVSHQLPRLFFSRVKSFLYVFSYSFSATPGFVNSAENKSNVDFTNHTGNCMNVSFILCIIFDTFFKNSCSFSCKTLHWTWLHDRESTCLVSHCTIITWHPISFFINSFCYVIATLLQSALKAQSLTDMTKCWSSGTSYDNFPKSADFACTFVSTHHTSFVVSVLSLVRMYSSGVVGWFYYVSALLI